MLELRPYQQDALTALQSAWSMGESSVCVSAPTGWGKTAFACDIARRETAQGGRTWFVCHLTTLIEQTAQRFVEYGVYPGVVQGANTHHTHNSVLVCSAQTLQARDFAGIGGSLPCVDSCPKACNARVCEAVYEEVVEGTNVPDLLILDEAHIGFKYPRRVARCVLVNGGRVVGLSATPYSRWMIRSFDALLTTTSTEQLADTGSLVPPAYREARPLYGTLGNARGAGEEADWSSAQLREAVLHKTLGEIPSIWLSEVEARYGRAVPTLVSVPLIDIGQKLAAQFDEVTDYRFEVVSARDGKDGLPTTDEVLRRFDRGETTGMISVAKLAIGFDRPEVQCVVLARPYATLTPFVQMVGRGLRPHEGKTDCLILDHAGNWARLGDAFQKHYADGPTDFGRPRTRNEESSNERIERSCDDCGTVNLSGLRKCAGCGKSLVSEVEVELAPDSVEMRDVDLVNPRYKALMHPDNEEWVVYQISLYAKRMQTETQATTWAITGRMADLWLALVTPADHYGCAFFGCRANYRAPKCHAYRSFNDMHPAAKHPDATLHPDFEEIMTRRWNTYEETRPKPRYPVRALPPPPRSVRCVACKEFQSLSSMVNKRNKSGLYTKCVGCRAR